MSAFVYVARAATIVAVLFAGCSIAAAQVGVRDHRGPAQPSGRVAQTPPAPSVITASPGPTESPQSTSRLTTIPCPVDRSAFFLPYLGLGGGFVGYGPLWSYDARPILLKSGQPFESAPVGGLQLDVEPRSGEVYVDGRYEGLVSDFSGYYTHLELVAGPHLVTVVAHNYELLSITVIVTPGYTATYRGTLTRAYGR